MERPGSARAHNKTEIEFRETVMTVRDQAARSDRFVGHGFRGSSVRAKIAVLASVVLCANATAEPAKYAVDGLAVGMQVNFDDASYREYRCSPSDQFEGLTWCQKTQGGGGSPGSRVIYSLLHSGDGSILCCNTDSFAVLEDCRISSILATAASGDNVGPIEG